MALFVGENGGDEREAQRSGEHPVLQFLSAISARLAGVAALVVGAALCVALASYDANDPSFLAATPQEPSNWLGGPGALVADPLIQGMGVGAWGLAALILVWGWRLAMAEGDGRFWSRLLAMPPALGALMIFSAFHSPWDSWQPSSGLGGALGDRGALVLLHSVPLPPVDALLWLTLASGVATLFLGALALGVTAAEARRLMRWLGASLWHTGGAAVEKLRDARGQEDAVPRSERMAPAEPTGMWKADQAPGAAKRAQAGPSRAAKAFGMARSAGAALGGAALGAAKGAAAAMTARERAARPQRSAEPAPTVPAMRAEPKVFRAPGDPAEPSVAAAAPDEQPAAATADRALAAAIRSLQSGEMPAAAGPVPAAEAPEPRGPAAADDEDETASAFLDPLGFDAEAEDDMDADRPIEPAASPIPHAPVEVALPRQTAPKKSRRAQAEAQPTLFSGTAGAEDVYEAPALALLQRPVAVNRPQMSHSALEENARMLETVLEDYGVRGEIVAVKPGPVVTLYELEPAPGLKASRVIGLADDIARSMSALSARIATVPGRSVIGIELPNTEREKVYLRETLEAPQYGDARYPLALALGKDIEGAPVIANLAKMPHLLIAGTTGSGKSVAINTMILSLLYRLSPEQCRVIMIDPKMLELSVYDNIPHLLAPVVTDPKKAVVALKWVVAEMEERYRKMSKMGVRNIDGYNARARDAIAKGEEFSRTIQTGFDEATGEPVYETQTFEPEEMPYIVVIVDEMADLMMVAGKEIEACIQRLAQMARASGIHLIMATQRPSVDVITGTIKANFPTRISFQVTSKIDSRTILGEQGAEQLLGMGDMLFMSGGGRIKRVHGPFVSDEEVEEVVHHLKSLGVPDYVGAVTEGADDETASLVDEKLGLAAAGDSDDTLYDKAVAIVARDRKCSTSYIQRKLAIGYNKAARLVEQMETEGVVTPANAVGKREILVEER